MFYAQRARLAHTHTHTHQLCGGGVCASVFVFVLYFYLCTSMPPNPFIGGCRIRVVQAKHTNKWLSVLHANGITTSLKTRDDDNNNTINVNVQSNHGDSSSSKRNNNNQIPQIQMNELNHYYYNIDELILRKSKSGRSQNVQNAQISNVLNAG